MKDELRKMEGGWTGEEEMEDNWGRWKGGWTKEDETEDETEDELGKMN